MNGSNFKIGVLCSEANEGLSVNNGISIFLIFFKLFNNNRFENCALLDYYAATSGNFLPTFQNNLSVGLTPADSDGQTD